jgi:hypothetical protein
LNNYSEIFVLKINIYVHRIPVTVLGGRGNLKLGWLCVVCRAMGGDINGKGNETKNCHDN